MESAMFSGKRYTQAMAIALALTAIQATAAPKKASKPDPTRCWQMRSFGECLQSYRQVVHKESRIGDHRFVYTDVVLDASGAGRVTSTFSNGNRTKGVHMCANTEFLDKQGRSLLSITHRAGLNPSYGGGAVEVRRPEHIKIPPTVARTVHKVEIEQTRCSEGGGLRQLKKGWKELAEFAKEAREDTETSKKKK